MKTIKIALFFVCALALYSCRLTTYTSEPGSIRKVFPAEMQGTYISVEKHRSGNDTTLLKILEKKTEINDVYLKRILQLSDSTTLTQLGDFYFFNVKHADSIGKPVWWTFPLLVNKKAMYVFTLTQGKQHRKIEKYLKPSGNARGEYIMDNEAFKKYCEKHLKKRKSHKLKRIK